MKEQIALKLLQMISLTIPPVAVLIQMLRQSENLPWRTRQFSFGLALTSVLAFVGAGAAILWGFLQNVSLTAPVTYSMALVVVGLVPFALFIGVLYVEHRANFG